MVRKILIYGDLDLNIIDGSSIWLVNLAKLLLEDKDNYVDVLLKKRIRNHILVGEIEKRYRIRLLYVKDYIDHITEVDRGNIVKVLETVDGLRDYSCMIIRGTPVMEQVVSSDIIGKVIASRLCLGGGKKHRIGNRLVGGCITRLGHGGPTGPGRNDLGRLRLPVPALFLRYAAFVVDMFFTAPDRSQRTEYCL